MNWNNAEINPPNHMDEVLVSDGDGSYTVAWYKKSNKKWFVAIDIIVAENHDGGCCISIDVPVKWWTEIDPVS